MEKYRKNLAHPWHGISIGPNPPETVNVYIELCPQDGIKYELDKDSGLLRVDRPQRFSSYAPAPYGMIPKTYCGKNVAKIMGEDIEQPDLAGDKDPLDIMVLTEKIVPHGDILMSARPLGGLGLLDRGEADDKLIAVLQDDAVYGKYKTLSDLPAGIVTRIKHYFLSYKTGPDAKKPKCTVETMYEREKAYEIIEASRQDYENLISQEVN